MLVAVSRAMCPRLRCSLGGFEANRAMWCLGTSCEWGAAVGTGPSCHCLPTPGRMGPISGCSDSRWVASALPPVSASLRTTQRVENGAAPLEKAGPAEGPLLSPRTWLNKVLISTQASRQARAIPEAGLVRPIEIRVGVGGIRSD